MNYYPHPKTSEVLSCSSCSAFVRDHEGVQPAFLVYYHLAICGEDYRLPFDPDTELAEMVDPGRSPSLDVYSLLIEATEEKSQGISPPPGSSDLFKATAEFVRKNSKSGRFPEESEIDRAFETARRKCQKDYIVLPQFRDARTMTQILLLMPHCFYPEDDKSPTGRTFLPILLIRRASLLVMKPPVDIDYPAILRDLGLIEEMWLDYFPSSERHNLYYVKTLCLMKLQLYADAKRSLEEAVEALEYSNLDQSKRDVRKEKMKKGMESIVHKEALNIGVEETKPVPPVLARANAKYPALSSKVDVISRPAAQTGGGYQASAKSLRVVFSGSTESRYPSEPGRGIVAKEDISPGEIIAVEDPIISSLRHDLVYVTHTHCHHCLASTIHLLPCANCCLVMFCSIACRDASNASYHKFECKLGLPVLSVALGASFQNQIGLSLRLLFSHSPTYWKQQASFRNFMGEPEYNMGKYLKNSAAYSSTDWKHFWNLENKFTSLAYIHQGLAITVMHAMKLVDSSTYLEKDKDKRNIITKVVAHAARVTNFNSLTMDEFKVKAMSSAAEQSKLLSIAFGQGIYNTISLFNHSCTKNASRFNCGNRMVVLAAKKINKGEEIFLSYTFNLLELPAQNRIDTILKEFGFQCTCAACREEWPPIDYRKTMDMLLPDLDLFESMKGGITFLNHLQAKNFDALLKHVTEGYEKVARKVLSKKDSVRWCDIGHCQVRNVLRIKHCIDLKW